MAVTRGEDVRAPTDPINRLTLQKKPATDGEAACWRVEKQGISVRAGGMIIGNGLQRTAVEGVGAGLCCRTCEPVGSDRSRRMGAREQAQQRTISLGRRECKPAGVIRFPTDKLRQRVIFSRFSQSPYLVSVSRTLSLTLADPPSVQRCPRAASPHSHGNICHLRCLMFVV